AAGRARGIGSPERSSGARVVAAARAMALAAATRLRLSPCRHGQRVAGRKTHDQPQANRAAQDGLTDNPNPGHSKPVFRINAIKVVFQEDWPLREVLRRPLSCSQASNSLTISKKRRSAFLASIEASLLNIWFRASTIFCTRVRDLTSDSVESESDRLELPL